MNKIIFWLGFLFISLKLAAQIDLNYDNKFQLALSYEDAGQLEKAEAILRELTNLQPWNYSYFDSLTRILLKQKKYPDAISLIESKINQSPQDINLYGLLGSVYFMSDNVVKAYEVWEKGLNVSPGSVVTYRIIANYAIENRAFEKAIEILQRGKKNTDEPEIFSFDLANVYLANMRFSEAANEYYELLIRKPDQLGNIKSKLSLYSDNKAALIQFIETLKNKIKDDKTPNLYDLLSYIYSLNSDYDSAFKILVDYENKIKGNGNTILSFARSAQLNGEYEVALKAYEYLMKNFPSSLQSALIKFYHSTALEEILNKKYQSELESWKPIQSKKIIYQNEFNGIIKTYESLIKDSSVNLNRIEILYRIAEIYFNRLLDYKKADSLYTLINLRGANTEFSIFSFLRRGIIAILNDQLDDANSLFEKVLMNNRTNMEQKAEANYFIAKINFWKSNFAGTIKYLDETTKNLSNDFANDAIELLSLINFCRKDSINLSKYALADLLSFQSKFSLAIEELKPLAANLNLFLLNDYANYKIAELLLVVSDIPTSLKILEDIAEKNGIFADKALLLLGKIYQYGVKDRTKASQIYQKLLEKFPNSLYFDQARDYLNNLQINNG
ncbi:MAG: tetratricopeptide repeat protein [Melioribacter sp.]|nr:tetratricopeptide repeat protein [Melioribacter sp.]